MAGKSSLHLIGQIPKTSGCVVSVGSMEVSMNSISLQRKHLQGLDPREPTGPQDGHPSPWWHWQWVGEGTREMTVMEI